MQFYQSLPVGRLLDEKFTLIGFEYAVCAKKRFYPCEVGVVQFSLSAGISDAYHTFISPFPFPMGYWAESKTHSDESHQIPIVASFGYWNEDYKAIFQKIKSMVSDSGVIFCIGQTDQLTAVPGDYECTYAENSGCMKAMMEASNGILSGMTVLPVENLAEFLVEKLHTDGLSASEIKTRLRSNKFYYGVDKTMWCFYHRDIDLWRCAYAAALRHCFNIIDMIFGGQYDAANVKLTSVPKKFLSISPVVGQNVQGHSDAGSSEIRQPATLTMMVSSQLTLYRGESVTTTNQNAETEREIPFQENYTMPDEREEMEANGNVAIRELVIDEPAVANEVDPELEYTGDHWADSPVSDDFSERANWGSVVSSVHKSPGMFSETDGDFDIENGNSLDLQNTSGLIVRVESNNGYKTMIVRPPSPSQLPMPPAEWLEPMTPSVSGTSPGRDTVNAMGEDVFYWNN